MSDFQTATIIISLRPHPVKSTLFAGVVGADIFPMAPALAAGSTSAADDSDRLLIWLLERVGLRYRPTVLAGVFNFKRRAVASVALAFLV